MDNWGWAWLYVASEWTIRLVMLFYVPQKRTPAAARTWLLLIFIHPWVGWALYAMFGRPYLPQRRIDLMEKVSKTLRIVGRDVFGRNFPAPALPRQFMPSVILAERLGTFSALDGNRLELLADYDDSINRLVADIDDAAHHVHLLYYIFANDRTGQRVADALIRAAQRGIHCRLMLDSLGSKVGLRELGPRLQAAGIEVQQLMPVRFFRRSSARMDLRNHRKIAVIDGHLAYVGSQNIVDADFRKGIINEELVARVSGPAVLQLQAVFLTDRFLETGTALPDPAFFPATQVTGTSPAQVLPSGPGYAHANNEQVIVSLLYAAEKRVVLTSPYFVPDESLLHAVVSAALRGVEVHLVVSQKIDQILVGMAQRSYYEELLAAGVKLHLYQPGLLHAKHVSIDDTVVVIGSSNLDLRSFLLNAEISLIVYDPHVGMELRRVQERNFSMSKLLTVEEWRMRPLPVKMIQNTARLVDSLL